MPNGGNYHPCALVGSKPEDLRKNYKNGVMASGVMILYNHYRHLQGRYHPNAVKAELTSLVYTTSLVLKHPQHDWLSQTL